MARRNSKSHSRNDHTQRGSITSTATQTHFNNYQRVLRNIHLLQQLELQNAYHAPRRSIKAPSIRRYHPNKLATIQTIDGSPARFNHNRLSTLYQSPWQLAVPHKVGVCQRRRERREVLHALKRTGKGSRARRKYTANTELHCR